MAGSAGASLLGMVCSFTRDVDAIADIHARCDQVKERLLASAMRDIEAFDAVMGAYRRDRHGAAYQQALIAAAEVSCDIMLDAASCADDALTLERVGNPNLVTDVAIGASLLAAALTSADFNVAINLGSMTEADERQRLRARADRALSSLPDLQRVQDTIRQRL